MNETQDGRPPTTQTRKHSGESRLGGVPKHWETRRLKGVCLFEYGDSLAEDYRTNTGVPVYGSNGLIGHTLAPNTERECLIIGRKGSSGKVLYSEEPAFAIDTTFFVDRRHTGANIRWLYYLLTSLNLESLSGDVGVPGLSRARAYQQACSYPPLEEQAAIVRYLDNTDQQIQRYIASKERLIALLEEERQALVHQAVTRGLDPNVKLKDSGVEWLGDVPEHWEVARFVRQVNIAEGQADPKIEPYASMLMIAPNHVESGTGRLLSRETAYEQGAISGKYFCRAGDVVSSKIRPVLAKVLVAPTDCLCSADMYPLRPRNSLQRDYLFWLLLSTGFTAWSVLQSDRVAMPKINRQALNNVHIPLPPLSEQVSIVRHLIEATAKASGAIDRARRQIELMEEYRTRLIADVVTGKIDVREAKP